MLTLGTTAPLESVTVPTIVAVVCDKPVAEAKAIRTDRSKTSLSRMVLQTLDKVWYSISRLMSVTATNSWATEMLLAAFSLLAAWASLQSLERSHLAVLAGPRAT